MAPGRKVYCLRIDSELAGLSLRGRLLALFAALLAAGFSLGIGALVLSAAPRVRAEADSVTRLSREFVETAIAGLRASADPGAALDRLVADFANLRHVRIRLDDGDAPAPHAAQSRAPEWFERLIDARPAAIRIPLDLPQRPGAAIVIESNPDDEVAEIWEEFRQFVVGGAAMALATFALVGFLVARSLRPVAAISQGLEQLERGDYAVRLSPDGPSDFVGMAHRLNALAERLAALAQENRALGQRIVQVQDEERREIARNLHDEFGPSLFAIRAGLAALARKAEGGAMEGAALKQATQAIGAQAEGLQQINRRILGQLRPAALGEFGLAAALGALVDSWRQATPHLDATLDVDAKAEGADETIALTTYRIVQEALTNVARHAGATRAQVRISCEGDRLAIRIVDDGAGFDPDAPRGLGLKGMSERIAALGGRLRLSRSEDGGAIVSADLPFRPG